MSISRPSAFSFGIPTAVLLSSFLPAVRADCWVTETSIGYYCDNTGLTDPARIGIGIAVFIVLFFVLSVIRVLYYRRRRAANMTNVQHAEGGGGNGPGQPPLGPQYPPKAYNGVASMGRVENKESN